MLYIEVFMYHKLETEFFSFFKGALYKGGILMAINQINSNEILNQSVLAAKTPVKTEKAQKPVIKTDDRASSKDKASFKAEVMSANIEASESRINSREEAEQMMRSVKKMATEKPENTIAVQANIAPDAALQLLMQ